MFIDAFNMRIKPISIGQGKLYDILKSLGFLGGVQ